MSILIIGANGGVGSKLVDQLKDDNYCRCEKR